MAASERPLPYASDLESAGPKSLVMLDGEGRVRGAGSRIASKVVYHGFLWSLIGLEGFLGYELFGWPGLSIAAGLGLLAARVLSMVRSLRLATEATVRGDADAAERRLLRLTRQRFVPRKIRARAYSSLAGVHVLRGDLEPALDATRTSIRLYRRSRGPFPLLARFAEVNLLARLERLDEAQAAFDALPTDIPKGEVMRLAHTTTELLLAFKRGEHQLEESALHERAQFALGITVAAPTLGLLSWAFAQIGEEEMSELLANEALDRPGEILEKRLPEVFEWVSEHKRAAGSSHARSSTPRVRVELDEADLASLAEERESRASAPVLDAEGTPLTEEEQAVLEELRALAAARAAGSKG